MSLPPLALSLDTVDPAVLFFGPFAVLATVYFFWLHRRKRAIAARAGEVERVAREVAATDPAFEPEKLLADAGALFHEVMRVWREKDVKALHAVTSPHLGRVGSTAPQVPEAARPAVVPPARRAICGTRERGRRRGGRGCDATRE